MMEFLMDNASPNTCPDGPQWIWDNFGECVNTPRLTVAFYIGLSSSFFWLFAQAPQLLANYRNGNAESLSVLFLFQWLAGDALNLIGAKMTHQLATQIITAYYFVCVDIVLIMQFTYYTVKSTLQDNAESKGTTRMYQASGSVLLLVSSVAVTAKSWMNEPDFADTTSRGTGRTLQAVHADNGSGMTTNEIGYMLGIASAAFYLSSRIPQIIKNIKRRSTGGLAFTMFLLAVVGNVTYSLGILITSTEKNFILQKLPWIVGSVGTVVFDLTIFFQFWIYGDRSIDPNTRVRTRSQSGTETDARQLERQGEQRPLLLPNGEVIYVNAPPPADEQHHPISPLIFPASQKPNYFR